MPNVKIFVDEHLLALRKSDIEAALGPLRQLLCDELKVPASACQIAVLPVIGLEDQPLANMEFQYLATPERTPDRIREACVVFRNFLASPLGEPLAVRATPLDPATYVALK